MNSQLAAKQLVGYSQGDPKISTAHGFGWVRTAIHHDFGLVLLEQGHAGSAFHQFQRCLQISTKVGERRYMDHYYSPIEPYQVEKKP